DLDAFLQYREHFLITIEQYLWQHSTKSDHLAVQILTAFAPISSFPEILQDHEYLNLVVLFQNRQSFRTSPVNAREQSPKEVLDKAKYSRTVCCPARPDRERLRRSEEHTS